VSRKTPTDSAAKGKLEPRQGFHDDGVNVLMVKLRIFQQRLVIRLTGNVFERVRVYAVVKRWII
jgi:hypothetical protein